MQRERTRWRADHGARALDAIGRIRASIEALENEDLLDLQDIFRAQAGTPLAEMADVEVRRRNLGG